MRRPGKTQGRTIDPSQISSASQIPPRGAQPVGLSSQGLVDVSCGTLPGDIDAQPSAKELLGTALDTGGLTNADYVYNQVSALYGGAQLPSFPSPSGNNVKSLVFVSGSGQGGYGAFHIGNGQNQTDFDRIVTDSLNVSGHYSAGSGLGSAMAPIAIKVPHLFAASRGPGGLLAIIHGDDPRLERATPAAIREAHGLALRTILALSTALEARNASAKPRGTPSDAMQGKEKEDLPRQLIHANQEILGLVRAMTRASGGRQYLSTALFVAEIVESFQTLTHKADPGKTDGEAVSRLVAFKLTPEISLVPGFNTGVTQQWWKNGHQDFVTNDSQNDQSGDGNASGVMFLLFLTDFLGIAVDQIIGRTPTTDGAPLSQTYANLLADHPELSAAAGKDGKAAFQKMVALLQKNAQAPDGTLNLPADGNPFASMPGAKLGGLFAASARGSGSLAVDAQAALGLEVQIEQQMASLKSTLQRIQTDVPASLSPRIAQQLASLKNALQLIQRDVPSVGPSSMVAAEKASFSYGPPLPASVVATLAQRVASYRAPQYDQTLQRTFWPHVYNELPGTGNNTDRLQVITGTIPAPQAVQITGTISKTKQEPDGDLHIEFKPDDAAFPTNQSSPPEPPLELEIIYAAKATQPDAQQAEKNYTNPFNISQLTPGTRIQAAGPLIFDRAHGRVDASGNVQYGLEIHPLAGMTVLTHGGTGGGTGGGGTGGGGTGGGGAGGGGAGGGGTGGGGAGGGGTGGGGTAGGPVGQLSADLTSALGQAEALGQTLGSLAALIQKMQGEAPRS